MSAKRQSNLFAAEDWEAPYRAFQEVNFTAYDFDSIKHALVEYIRSAYPEDFNDWVQSSEFVAIIDLLSYLGQSLSFRVDLNARENFMDTAERRESILRLAQMLSYTPKRNIPASGMLKIESVQTDEHIFDSNGIDLSGITIAWNDTSNVDWYEQFILVLNASFEVNNPYGLPVKRATVEGLQTDIYNVNSSKIENEEVKPFTMSLSQASYDAEIIPSDFKNNTIIEAVPNASNPFRIVYMNDGQGNNSSHTGFFIMMKQGTLEFTDIAIDTKEENRIINIDEYNINETDVWVQSINADGTVIKNWSRVATEEMTSNNIIFNSINNKVRDIYSVVTRENDQISLKFADGRFGNIPTGRLRVWYRRSNGLNYEIKPRDIKDENLSIAYRNDSKGVQHSLVLTYSLKTSITNSAPAESDASIKDKAPRVYSTQNRMVNGSDYNIFPATASSDVIKLKAINRTYSGHSRYLDVNDPTGSLQDVSVFAKDGILYRTEHNSRQEVKASVSKDILARSYIANALKQHDLKNFYYNFFAHLKDTNATLYNSFVMGADISWETVTSTSDSCTGYFKSSNQPVVIGYDLVPDDQKAQQNIDTRLRLITTNALVQLINITDPTDVLWVQIEQVNGNGTSMLPNGDGPVRINQRILSNKYQVEQIIPAFMPKLPTFFVDKIVKAIETKSRFGIGYDMSFPYNANTFWYIIGVDDINDEVSDAYNPTRKSSHSNDDASWLVYVDYDSDINNSHWILHTRGTKYVFESEREVEFYFSNMDKTFDPDSGRAVKDSITILGINQKPSSNASTNFLQQSTIGRDITWEITGNVTYNDGYEDPKRVFVSPADNDDDGSPDDPFQFAAIVNPSQVLVYERYTTFDGYEYTRPVKVNIVVSMLGELLQKSPSELYDNDLIMLTKEAPENRFRRYDASQDLNPSNRDPDLVFPNVSNTYFVRDGVRNNLVYHWTHYAPKNYRIDPSVSNIIDIFILDKDYHEQYVSYVKDTAANVPELPTSDSLWSKFSSMNEYKVISDQLIWKPAKYKVLFGSKAPNELQARFKVIKSKYASMTDNEIKTNIVAAIDKFFDVNNWDFGDNFFASELNAYIHYKLSTQIDSVVLVPLNTSSKFGNLYEIPAQSDELFISSAQVSDIEIIETNTRANIRIGA